MIIFILGKYYLHGYLHVLGGSSIFHYNLQLEEKCSIIVKTFPGFYQELIEHWCKISYQEPSDIIQIYYQCLWNTSFMLTQGKPILNLSFINKGLLKVSDILNESGNLMSWQSGKSKYNLDNKDFMSWIGLIESIPQKWKKKWNCLFHILMKATIHVSWEEDLFYQIWLSTKLIKH